MNAGDKVDKKCRHEMLILFRTRLNVRIKSNTRYAKTPKATASIPLVTNNRQITSKKQLEIIILIV